MEENRTLGKDLSADDQILQGIKFSELIASVKESCSTINEVTALIELQTMIDDRVEAAKDLYMANMKEIVGLAKED